MAVSVVEYLALTPEDLDDYEQPRATSRLGDTAYSGAKVLEFINRDTKRDNRAGIPGDHIYVGAEAEMREKMLKGLL